MLRRIVVHGFVLAILSVPVYAQLPADAVILSKVKIAEKQKSVDLCPVHLVPSNPKLPKWTRPAWPFRGHSPIRASPRLPRNEDGLAFIAASRNLLC